VHTFFRTKLTANYGAPDFIGKFLVGLKVFEALVIGFANGGNTASVDLWPRINAVVLKITLEGFRSLNEFNRTSISG